MRGLRSIVHWKVRLKRKRHAETLKADLDVGMDHLRRHQGNHALQIE